jgi:KTSC domain
LAVWKVQFSLAIFIAAKGANAETVDVKYGGAVDLKPFACEEVTRSSFIRRVCYDAGNRYMLIKLNETWYHYCSIDAEMVNNFKGAPSMGRYFNSAIKGRFDCGTNHVPRY